MKKTLFLLSVCLLLMGCAIQGKVYVSIIFQGNTQQANLTGISTTIPNIPAFGSIDYGRYYETLPGAYSFTSTYLPANNHIVNFNISVKSTMMGYENVYYDIVLIDDNNAVIREFPN